MNCHSCGTDVDRAPYRAHWDEQQQVTVCGDCYERNMKMTESKPKAAPRKTRPRIRYHLVEERDNTKVIHRSAADADTLMKGCGDEALLRYFKGELRIERGWLEPAEARFTAGR